MKLPKYATTFMAIGAVATALLSGPAHAGSNILFILDGSNSMWGKVEGEAKIKTAQKVMGKLLADLPKDTGVGFMAYGHRKEKACDDIEVLSPIAKGNAQALAAKIDALQPKGKTPIAGALKKSLAILSKHKGDDNYVVLVSDGVETCGGDPCAAAKALADAGIHARVHVVGFAVGESERKALSCISTMGKGRYFSAANAAQLTTAFAEVKKEVVKKAEKKPEPKPAYEVRFEDKFDGAELAPHWQVANPNPDSFIQEKGSLLLLAHAAGGLANATQPNIIKLDKPLPDGDWVVTAEIRAEIQTGHEIFSMGLYTDAKNFISSNFYSDIGYVSNLYVKTSKVSAGKETLFAIPVWTRTVGDFRAPADYVSSSKMPSKTITLQLVKNGRSYHSRLHIDGHNDKSGKPVWAATEPVTSLRAPKSLVINAAQLKPGTKGETLFYVEDLKIEVPKI